MEKFKRNSLSLAVGLATALAAKSALAQEINGAAIEVTPPGPIEEVVVTGRFKSVAASIVDERIDIPYSADFLGFEAISRAGDSTIAGALRRLPGLTLIDSKFVYIRGLGERYSSVTVNGAVVPSPDLARSVIPLDLFPTSIVESIKVQKAFGSSTPANFGGGAIDIRTKSFPKAPLLSISVGAGGNSVSSSGLQYSDSSIKPLPGAIADGIARYRGDISQSNIFATENNAGNNTTAQQAELIQRNLMLALPRNVAIEKDLESLDSDYKLALGNAFDVGYQWLVGGSISASVSDQFRNKDQVKREIGNPESRFSEVERTAEEHRETYSATFGVEYGNTHALGLSYFDIQHDVKDAFISRGFDQNNSQADGDQVVRYQTRAEERQLQMYQLTGKHSLEGLEPVYTWTDQLGFLESLRVSWFYSDAEVTTDVPNQSNYNGTTDLGTGFTQISPAPAAGQHTFLELNDDEESWGGDFELPLFLDSSELTVRGGYAASEKLREYYQYTFNVNTTGLSSSVLSGGPGRVMSDPILGDLDNNFSASLGSNFGTESYVAVRKLNAYFGELDWRLNEYWRITLGSRWEEYKQALLTVDLLDFTGASVQAQAQALADPNQRFAFVEDDWYHSAALTYADQGMFGAEEYQLRASFAQTTVRPDLRETAQVVYIDPEINQRVRGNPFVEKSDIDHVDLRAEFFYENGDNFTVSLFYKDIKAPIETVRQPGSDDNVVLTYQNADSGSIVGVEVEGLLTLPADMVGVDGFFISGNIALSDSDVEIDTTNNVLTNDSRRLTGHSEYVMNAQLGFDSPDGVHSASLIYNVFGDRIYFAGVAGNDDAFELPFHSLDLTYTFYPTDTLSFSVKVQNILEEEREFEQDNASGRNVAIIEQEVGRSWGLSAKWSY
ncbi:TonB-dependent receptor domain-containing protein [Litorivivens sp.]|uniref:TonB-dependent receptor domain-containing protein n=1 Tax=Litorivivens sp. TaxID=2020868 RepID=UPI003569C885